MTTLEQDILNSISHWKRMIAWARDQNPKDPVDSLRMETSINESWYARDCPLCQRFIVSCDLCPLTLYQGRYHTIKTGCGGDSAWLQVELALTWRQWVKAARKMLYVLQHC